MQLAHYLGLLLQAEHSLSDAFQEVGRAHAAEADVYFICQKLVRQCDEHAESLRPFVQRYSEQAPDEPERLHSELFQGSRSGGLGLLRDLQDLYLMTAACDICWVMMGQAAQGARDSELYEVATRCGVETSTQAAWLRTRMKQAAPQALVVS